MKQIIYTVEDFLLMTEKDVLDTFQPERTHDDYIFIDRQHPITIVAHADTCKRAPADKFALHRHNNVITAKNSILGADDRAGCFAAWQLMHRTPVNVLITTGEETGGIGARRAALDLDKDLAGCNLMIEFDRQGCNDYVFYSYDLHNQLKSLFQSFGFVQAYGSYSDIAEFSYIPSVNVSCGYYAQHTTKERLHVDELNLSIDRITALIDNYSISKRLFPPTREYYKTGRRGKKQKNPPGGFSTLDDDFNFVYGGYRDFERW